MQEERRVVRKPQFIAILTDPLDKRIAEQDIDILTVYGHVLQAPPRIF